MNITFHKFHLDPKAFNDFIILQCLAFSLKNELIYLKTSLTINPLNNPLLSISPPFVRIWSTNFHLRKKMWKSNAYIDTLCIAVALMQDHRTSLKIWQPFYRRKYLIYIAYKSMMGRKEWILFKTFKILILNKSQFPSAMDWRKKSESMKFKSNIFVWH